VAPRLSNREKALRCITEARFQADVEQLLTLFGWRWFHAPANKPSASGRVQNVKAGFPDLCAVRGTRLLFAELKTQTGRLGPGQPEWLDGVERAGAESYLWRPEDMETIRTLLASPERPAAQN
jgi:hypothetical protein